MKEKFLNIQFLVYAVLLFAATSMLESMFTVVGGDPTIDPGKVEVVLKGKEQAMDTILAQVRNDFESGGWFEKDNALWMYRRDMDHLKDEGFSVFIYDNDTLRYWSDNSVDLHKLFSKAEINNTVKYFTNGWYVVRTVTVDKTVFIGLILIKHQYKYSNKYICNRYAKSFDLDTSLRISLVPISYGVDIRDGEKNYLFSIVPTNSVSINNAKPRVAGVVFLAAVVMLLVYLKQLVVRFSKSPGKAAHIVAVIAGVITARVVLWAFNAPDIVYSLDFFDPIYFNDNGIFATIGDFIINVVVLLFILQYVSLYAEYVGFKDWIGSLSQTGRYIVWAVMFAGFFWMFGYLYHETCLLVVKGKISFQLTNVMTLDVFSITGIVIVTLLTANIIYTVVAMTRYFDYGIIVSLRRAVVIYLLASVVLSLLVWMFTSMIAGLGVLYALLLIGTAMYMHYSNISSSVYVYIFMLFLSAMYLCTLIFVNTNVKNNEHSASLISNPSDYSDPVAELLIAEMSKKIIDDNVVPDILRQEPGRRDERMRDYLQHQFFGNYWSRYYLNVKVLESANGNFSDIDDPFVRSVNTRGTPLGTTSFYLVSSSDGSFSYYAPLKFCCGDGTWCFVCISLDRKLVPQDLGYPSLLIDSKVTPFEIDGSDYVRYHNGVKISQYGNYSYDMIDHVFAKEFTDAADDTLRVMEMNGYIHVVYHKDGNTMVMSREQDSFADYVVQLAYLFMIFIAVMLVYLMVKMLVDRDDKYRYKIKTRLILAITVVLLLSFVGICGGTVYININKFQSQNSKTMDDKVKSVCVHVEQLCGDTLSFKTRWNPDKPNDMDHLLANMSHVFLSDVNIYGVDGEMIACSRPQIFKDGLVSSRINRTALQRFVIDGRSTFDHEEHIGDMGYASAYMPIYNNNEKLLGYVNLPYFTKPEELERELSTIIVSILNLYVVLMMVSVMIGVIISERIVQPIKMIQSKMETIELGKNYEKIDYDRKDELGQLVAEYNNMVDKLDESAKLLAKGERESAWREMAKQVAHEIKNPLTPMKLSIQFLTRSWESHNDDFENVLNRVSNTLIQQIDTLSSIATGFSNFAKLPQPNAKPLNIVEIIDNVVQLYHTVENADITSDMGGHKDVIVMADREQMTRVFVNIIKNATQAIPEGVRGKIHVSLDVQDAKVVVRIADNGCGIPDEIREKLFTPNFTTKSSGSGLGLAMVKNMVINAKGEITFESEVGKGTTFIITLPVKEG